jgi:hypothetical protein
MFDTHLHAQAVRKSPSKPGVVAHQEVGKTITPQCGWALAATKQAERGLQLNGGSSRGLESVGGDIYALYAVMICAGVESAAPGGKYSGFAEPW